MEIIAHIGNLADPKTTLALRSTCHTYFAVISNKRFILHNLQPENAHSVLKPLRHLRHISIEIRNTAKKSATTNLLQILFEELSHLDIYRLNIAELKHPSDALSLLTRLNNLQSLDVRSANTKALNSFHNLTRLNIIDSSPQLTNLTNLEELHICHQDTYVPDDLQLNSTNLTKLVLEHMHWFARHIDTSNLRRLKVLTVHGGGDFSEELPDLTELESLTMESRIHPSVVSELTRLTRLELSKGCFGHHRPDEAEDLSSYSRLTKLKVLSISHTDNKFVKAISFISKLPLVSATILQVTRDDAECIQHFKPHLLKELSVSINNTSMFKNELARLTRLEALQVHSTTVVLVGGIDTLTLLTRLVLVKAQCKSVERLTRLKILHADLTNSNTMNGWTALTNLEQLNAKINTQLNTKLNTNAIADVARLTNLNHLTLDFDEPFESNSLSCLTRLTHICLPKFDYQTLDWLAPLTALEHLDLKNSTITMRDVVALTNLKQLTYLSVLNPHKYSNELRGLTKLAFE